VAAAAVVEMTTVIAVVVGVVAVVAAVAVAIAGNSALARWAGRRYGRLLSFRSVSCSA